jgi:hypothetical protein
MVNEMNDSEILQYLLSHAPLERFYLYEPNGAKSVLMMYFDETGRSWSLMEDDDHVVASATSFLKRSGVNVFHNNAALVEYQKCYSSLN